MLSEANGRSLFVRRGQADWVMAWDSRLAFRRLRSSERGRLLEHLLGLDPVDRRSRFCGAASDLCIRAYCDGLNWRETTVIACFADGAVCGVLELLRQNGSLPMGVELALSVQRDTQNLGIGTELLRRGIVIARNRFVGTVSMLCLRENRKMQHIARKLGAELVTAQGEVQGIVHPSWPSCLSAAQEATMEGEALLRAVFGAAPSSHAVRQA